MAERKLLRDVHVTEDDNTVTVLTAGSTVPKKLARYVTNPKAYAPEEVDVPAEQKVDETVGYDTLDLPGLKALLEARTLAVTGNKKALIKRLEEHDIELKAEAEAKAQAEGNTGEAKAYADLELEELQELLSELELPTEGEHADLVARLEEFDAENGDDENQE